MSTLRELRLKANLSQEDLAEKLGVHQTAVSQWETDRTFPAGKKIPLLAEVLGCSIEDLYAEPTEGEE